MAGSTPIFHLRYPSPPDPADVPTDLQNLALDVEGVLGGELAYDQITADFAVTGLGFAAAQVVIPGTAHTYDGSPVIVEFFASLVSSTGTAGGGVGIVLFDGATSGPVIAAVSNPATGTLGLPMLARTRITPSAGSHTYAIRAYIGGGGSGSIGAGNGASGNRPAAYLRILRATS